MFHTLQHMLNGFTFHYASCPLFPQLINHSVSQANAVLLVHAGAMLVASSR